MDSSAVEVLLKQYRKSPLASSVPIQLDFGRREIERIIPHRDPILLLDSLTGLDPAEGILTGTRHVPAEDPVFRGHFPDMPLYPGTLTVEMIGQLGLCLYHFVMTGGAEIAEDARPVPVRATRILGSSFLEPIRPDSEVTLVAKGLENDGFFAAAIGQAMVGDVVCCVSVGEVCFLE